METRLEQLFKTWSRRARMAAAVGGLLLGGCADDEVTTDQPEKGERITFTAIAPTGSMSKAFWNAEPNETTGKLGFNWENTDTRIDLWQGGTTIIPADMSVNAEDRSSVTITAEGVDVEKDFAAFFPSEKVTFEGEVLNFPVLTLPAELTQKGASTEHLRDYMYLVGYLTPEQLASDEIPPMQLQHACAVLRFKVVNGTSDAVRVTKVEMLATEADKGVTTQFVFPFGEATPSDITVNVVDAEDETKGHALAAGESLSVYAHCFRTEVSDGQFQFRVTVTDADGNNEKVFLTEEEFSVEGITTSDDNDNKIFQMGYYYTFHLDISKTGAEERFMPTWMNGIIASESVEGDGSEENPYLIASAEDLQWLIDKFSSYYNKHFKLTTDIYIHSDGENQWPTLGYPTNQNSYPFKGTFDGDGHTIYGTMVADNSERSGDYYFGFFSKIGENGTVKNLNIKADVTGRKISGHTLSCISHTGSIAGQNEEGTIENCTAGGTVTGGDVSKKAYSRTGGIVGYNNTGTVTNCSNSGAVKGGNNVSGTMQTGSYTGGIVGESTFSSTVENCTNSGAVTGGISQQFDSYTGGIAGYNRTSTLTRCTNSGTVTKGSTVGSSTGAKVYAGGLVGNNDGSVCTCSKDESNYSEGGTAKPIGNGSAQSQVEGCTGTHPEE